MACISQTPFKSYIHDTISRESFVLPLHQDNTSPIKAGFLGSRQLLIHIRIHILEPARGAYLPGGSDKEGLL